MTGEMGPAGERAGGTSLTKNERRLATIVERLPLEELAARALAEGRRLGAVMASPRGGAWEQLAAEGVISSAQGERLREAKDTRNELDHFYPPTSWKVVHEATAVVMGDLDDYVDRVVAWAASMGIRVPGP